MAEGKEKKVLVVEDEKAMANAMKMKLSHEGIVAETAFNGEDGLALAKEGAFDLILLDLVMPKMDGFAVLEALKKEGVKSPVIILSNLSQEEDEKKTKEMGAQDFFIKSNTPITDIVVKVKGVLGL